MSTRYTTASFRIVCIIATLFAGVFSVSLISDSQQSEDTGIRFEKKLTITLTNPLNMKRIAEAVIIPLDDITSKAPDFNRNFFRVKHQAGMFEPLDIPSQIYQKPGSQEEVLTFVMDFAPNETRTVELLYNPAGEGLPDYPDEAKVYEEWYHIGSNIAWENKLVAYRSYSGIVDYFAKTYPHLRLHDLPPDSYHHESLWGLDPYLVGEKPGLGGMLLFDGSRWEKCYDVGENSPLTFIHKAFADGPVCAGASVQVINKGALKVTSHFMLFTGRHDNDVTVAVPASGLEDDMLVAPGMQKYDGEKYVCDKRKGYCLSYGIPVVEYGTIATALIWNPNDASGEEETEDGHFIKLKLDSDGTARYRCVAVWYRASADQPESLTMFENYVQGLALSFNTPLKIFVK